MKITKTLTDEALLKELGARMARHRLEKGLSQKEVAQLAGISKRTVERIESGASSQWVNVLRFLRAVGALEGIEAWMPEPGLRPVELFKLKGKVRKRASKARGKKRSPETTSRESRGAEEGSGKVAEADQKPWVWGENK